MPRPASEQVQQNWKDNILNQRQSGLPISTWCRQNNITVPAYYYWRDRLFPKAPLERSSFTEITGESMRSFPSGITLRCHECTIILDRQFDAVTLRKCLEVLKKC
jgi:hypothetical protein